MVVEFLIPNDHHHHHHHHEVAIFGKTKGATQPAGRPPPNSQMKGGRHAGYPPGKSGPPGKPQDKSWLMRKQTAPAFAPPAPAEAAASWANHAAIASQKANDALRDIQQIRAGAVAKIASIGADADQVMLKVEGLRSGTAQELQRESALVWTNYQAAKTAVEKMLRMAEKQALAAHNLAQRTNDSARELQFANNKMTVKTSSVFARLDAAPPVADAGATVGSGTSPAVADAPGDHGTVNAHAGAPAGPAAPGDTGAAGPAVDAPGESAMGDAADSGRDDGVVGGSALADDANGADGEDAGVDGPETGGAWAGADSRDSAMDGGDADSASHGVDDTAGRSGDPTDPPADGEGMADDGAGDGETAPPPSANRDVEEVMELIRKYMADLDPSAGAAKTGPGPSREDPLAPIAAHAKAESSAASAKEHSDKIAASHTKATKSLEGLEAEAKSVVFMAKLAAQTLLQDTATAVNESLKAAHDAGDAMLAKAVDSEREIMTLLQQAQQSVADAATVATDAENVATQAARFAQEMASKADYAQNAAGQAMAAQMAQAMGYPVAMRGEPSPFPPLAISSVPMDFIVGALVGVKSDRIRYLSSCL